MIKLSDIGNFDDENLNNKKTPGIDTIDDAKASIDALGKSLKSLSINSKSLENALRRDLKIFHNSLDSIFNQDITKSKFARTLKDTFGNIDNLRSAVFEKTKQESEEIINYLLKQAKERENFDYGGIRGEGNITIDPYKLLKERFKADEKGNLNLDQLKEVAALFKLNSLNASMGMRGRYKEFEEMLSKYLYLADGSISNIDKLTEKINNESKDENKNQNQNEVKQEGYTFKQRFDEFIEKTIYGDKENRPEKGKTFSLDNILKSQAFTSTISYLKEAFSLFDKDITSLQKTLILSDADAQKIRRSFVDISSQVLRSKDNLAGMMLTTEDMVKSTSAIANNIGLVGIYSKQFIEQITLAQKGLGLSDEQVASLASNAAVAGTSIQDTKIQALGAATNVGIMNGFLLNSGAILKEALSTTGGIRLNFHGNITELSEGIAKAQILGLTLKDVQQTSNLLLNFQQSISAELEAELLIQRPLNLERARAAALTGNMKVLTEEINKNVGSWADYNKLNVIQQEALAKAVGYSRDQLGDILFKQESLNKLKAAGYGDEQKSLVQNYQALRASGKSQEDINKLLGEGVAKQLEQESVGQQWNDLLLEIKSAIAEAFGGTSRDAIKNIIHLVAQLAGALSEIARMIASLGPLAPALVGAIGGAAVGGAPGAVLGGLFGLAGGISASTQNTNSISSTGDLYSSGNYGDRILITPQKSYALNNNDTILAGTNLNKANDIVSTGKEGEFSLKDNNNSTDKLSKQFEDFKNVMIQLVNRPISLEINKTGVQKWTTESQKLGANSFLA